jgi:CheY-like chemotaxis protein
MAVGVLIVEDEFLLRAEAADFFEESGFTVYKASHADEAVALLELHDDIRAVFTDIHMPGSMDGLNGRTVHPVLCRRSARNARWHSAGDAVRHRHESAS